MKKLTLILAFIGMITLNSCSNDDDVDNDTIAHAIEFPPVNFNSAGGYGVFLNYPQIYSSDMVLVYRLAGNDGGLDVWSLLPETFYFDDGTLDFRYNFDFTSTNVNVYLEGFDLPGINPNYTSNQIFRVVIIPAYLTNKSVSGKNTVDFKDYNAVVKAYHIKESDIKKMK